MNRIRPNRRQVLQATACAAASMSTLRLFAEDKSRLFRIGACDWSLGKPQQFEAMDVAKQIGLDGVQVSFGEVGRETDLRQPSARTTYAKKTSDLGIEIASLAMGVLNQRPYWSDPDAEQWVADCISVMAKMKQRVVLLAFFSKGDIKDNPSAQKEVIRRLKKVAPAAEKAGVVLGLETWLNVDEHLRILDAVGSPAVQVYYDVANMEKQGYDIYEEIRQLGRERICEVHTKENGFLLGQGKIDFPKVKAALDDIGWNGWLIIESATIKSKSLVDCYTENQQYLRSVFPTG